MPVPVGLLFTGLILRTILGVVVIAALLVFSWKIGRLADAYTENRGRLIVLHLRTCPFR